MFETQSDEIKKYIYDYAKNPQAFLLLSGKNGRGKSHAAMLIYEANTPYKLPAYSPEAAIFINQTELNIKFGKASKEGWAEELLHQMISTKLLVLDDIGTRIPSVAFMDFLYAIVDSRYTNRKVCGTVLTTNLNANDMRLHFGDAFVSRVASTKCFRFEGQDARFNDF